MKIDFLFFHNIGQNIYEDIHIYNQELMDDKHLYFDM
jgi:hypothetical protein